MKYYQLKKDLPIFNKGELFYINDYGQLISRAHQNVVAYSGSALAKFPGILKDWFEEVPAPVRDVKTKAAFEAYMTLHPEERFFQAVRNFTRKYLDKRANVIAIPDNGLAGSFVDTFYWECDEMLKGEEE
jgi:hypothetical protein